MGKVQVEVFFSAIDSLYFRGSRPHSAAGASQLPSDFPAPISTLVGCIRTRLGDALGFDWAKPAERRTQVSDNQAVENRNLAQLIGGPEDTGQLRFGMAGLYKGGQRLYPVPAVLLQTDTGQLVRLELGDAVVCDLGHVRLAQLPQNVMNAKPIENGWLTESGLQRFLNGNLPKASQLVNQEDIFHNESRLGIGRDAALATVKSGLLYQTEHLRLADDVEFSITVELPDWVLETFLTSLRKKPLQRLGGEGRMAYLRASTDVFPVAFNRVTSPSLLLLLSDLLVDSTFSRQPIAELHPVRHEGIDCWDGTLNGVKLRLLSVVSAKARRTGGWDMRNNRPREVQSYLPAGSCFFVQTIGDDSLTKLNGHQIGRCTDYGLGTLVCGR